MKAEDPGAAAAAPPASELPIRAAEVVGALSIATDLGTAQPLEHALRSAVLAVRLGELAGASAQELADTYYVALLHASGCTSNGHEATQVFGEDIAHRAAFFLIDTANPAEVLAFYRAYVGAGRSPEVRATMVEAAIANVGSPRSRESFATMCEVAQRFAGWLDLGPNIQAALEYVFARWDGHGFPDTRGDAIPFPMRLLHVARDISLFLSAAGADEARTVVERRTGTAYEPRLAELAVRNFDDLLSDLDELRMWDQALEIEPFPQIRIAGDRVDAAFTAIATLTGLKSPWLREHSTGVADLAEAAAWRTGLPAASVTLVRRAALAHDLGRVGVSNAIWEKPGPLGFGEWERVRLHPHFTERAFAQSTALAPIGMLAGSHHERLDGSGYHRGTRGPALDQAARILAAADCYGAMCEARPHRAALDAPAAEKELTREATEGRLDPDAVDAVLAAAGHRVKMRPRELPAGLTERELEVLLVLVRGGSNQQIADDLGISAKTVGSHVEHVYQKAGVRSRAAATVWAFEQDLVRLKNRACFGDKAKVLLRRLPQPLLTLTLALAATLVLGLANAGAAANAPSVAGQRAGDAILGYWNLSGGVVQVIGGPASFTGTIAKATRFSDCDHPAGEVIWQITKTGTSYTGTHQWFGSAAPDCKLGGPSMRGAANWSVIESGSSLGLHFCTTNPENRSDTRCSDLTRAKPAVAWPPLPDALVPLESVSNGCGGGPAGNDKKYGDDSSFADTELPFDNVAGWNKAKHYHVNFREACKQHDAGYSHAKVHDMALNGGKVIDYFGYSKAAVDKKFLEDMRKICDAQIPASAKIALNNCKHNGGFHFVSGAKTRYNLVAGTTYTQKIWKGLGFYQEPPRLSGTWTTGLSGNGDWSFEQRGRLIVAKWSGGSAAPNVTAELRAMIISHDDTASIKGSYIVTTNGVAGEARALTLTWSPKLPDEIRVSTGFTLKR